jgi:hypothetical protein
MKWNFIKRFRNNKNFCYFYIFSDPRVERLREFIQKMVFAKTDRFSSNGTANLYAMELRILDANAGKQLS